MKTIALLSGGKDSIYNLLHSIINGHEPICVASLGPPKDQDEMDSFMYQTVAHSGLQTLSQALDLPFFSHTIKGKPLNLSNEYGDRSNTTDTTKTTEEGEKDETEDLFELLKQVKTAMPQVEAVACGAILSNYQRVRVEHVCRRLNLTPIAYLWQRNQKELLNEMCQSGLESVVVKVAGAGLGVQHLGKTLQQMEPILWKLNERYETHICGEGGEYETFTLDSPIFKRKIQLDETRTIVSNPDPHSTVAHLYLSELSLLDKPDYPHDETFEELQERLRRLVKIPEVLGDEGDIVRDKVEEVWRDDEEQGNATDGIEQGIEGIELSKENYSSEERGIKPIVNVVDGWVNVSNISTYTEEESTTNEMSIEEELKLCFGKLIALLESNNSSLTSLSHLNLSLSSSTMSLFPRINSIYTTYFGTSPPTRACVAVHFPPRDRSRVKLDGVARIEKRDGEGEEKELRTALHVQSLSYWGAANIGPYSQAITVKNRCYIAGQIPLIPSSLSLPSPSNFPLEIALSLQHVSRIVTAASEQRWEGWMEGGVGWIAEPKDGGRKEWRKRVKACRVGWRSFNEERNRENSERTKPAPILFVSAAQLPRSASVEWQVTWQTGQVPWTPEDDDTTSDEEDGRAAVERRRKPRKVEPTLNRSYRSSRTGSNVTWQCSPVREIADSVVAIITSSIDELDRPEELDSVGSIHSIKAFYRPSIPVERVESLARKWFDDSTPLTCIGSKYISSCEDEEDTNEPIDVAFVVVAQVLES